jgi:hypothetical protein
MIAKAWDAFAARVMPPNVSDIQRREMKRAFYAGAAVLLEIQLQVLEPGTEPTQKDLAVMDRIAAELKAFFEGLTVGRN